MQAETIETEIPEAFGDLFTPSRYKIFYGGRGGAKSWNFAKALLIKGTEKPLRILCAREFQRSIAESVHSLLSDQIRQMGMQDFYEVQQTKITGANGTSFGFAGLHHNITEIKGYEGADIAWVEEGQAVSARSWDILIPTIRKDASEVWVSFNPELEDDPTYKRFVKNPPANSIVKKVGWRDNPWFPDVLRAEMEDLKERDPDAFQTVWEGNCRVTLDGAVYANEIRRAKESGRICRAPYDKGSLVHTAWDLGWGDATAIWCVQRIGGEVRLIDYIEDRGVVFADYVRRLQEKGYALGTAFLPHDAESKNLQTGKSVKEVAERLMPNVQIVPKMGVDAGIEAVRQMFDGCVFDETNCADGIRALSHYRYEYNEDLQSYKRVPLHDWASHGADAFRYLAVMSEHMSVRTQRRRSAPVRNRI